MNVFRGCSYEYQQHQSLAGVSTKKWSGGVIIWNVHKLTWIEVISYVVYMILTSALFLASRQVLPVHLIQHILEITAPLSVRAMHMKLGYTSL